MSQIVFEIGGNGSEISIYTSPLYIAGNTQLANNNW